MRNRSVLIVLAFIFIMSMACAHMQSALNTGKQLDNGFYQALLITSQKMPELQKLAKTDPTAKLLLPEVVKNYQLAKEANLELTHALQIWQQAGTPPADYPALAVKLFTLLGQIAVTGQRAGVDMTPLTDKLNSLINIGGTK